MPEELMLTGSGDHWPEHIRRDGQIDIIRPLVNADLPLTAGAGLVRRSISKRLGDFISVKDFGATGDGSTDDRLAIVAALEALSTIDSPSRTLYFPPGVYMLNSVRWTVAEQISSSKIADPRQVLVFLDNPNNPSRRGTKIVGYGATIRCGFELPNPIIRLDQLNAATPYSMSQVSTMITLINGGGDLIIEGLKIDGDNRAGIGLEIRDQQSEMRMTAVAKELGKITIRSCQFLNMYMRRIPYNSTDLTLNTTDGAESPRAQSNNSLQHPVGGSGGLVIQTPSSNILVDGCVVKNIGRDPFAGVPTTTGCHGIFINAGMVGGMDTSDNIQNSLYYVSEKVGNDQNAGTIDSPVKTIGKAAALARADTSGKNIHILIRGGEYKMLGTYENPIFFLNADDSGKNGKNITYKAYGNEEVVITGSEKIDPSVFRPINATQDASVWNKIKPNVRSKIVVADLINFDLGPQLPSVWDGRFNGSVYQYVNDLPTIPELFFNNKRMTIARWPNVATNERSGYTFEDSAYVESIVNRGTSGIYAKAAHWGPNQIIHHNSDFSDGIFKYPSLYDSVINNWTSSVDQGMWVHGFWRFDWSDEVFKVVNIDTNLREITVRSRRSRYALQNYTQCDTTIDENNRSYYANHTPRRWYAFNLIEELDAPEEYFIDTIDFKLYFYPPQDIHLNSSITFSHRAAGGPTQDGSYDNYTEDGYNFPYPGWSPEVNNEGSYTQNKDFRNTKDILKSLFKFRKVKDIVLEGLIFKDCSGSGIELNMCENITINKCKIFNIRKDGIAALGGKNIIIQKCEVYDIGRNGIINTGGNRQELISANKIVTECSIKRWGRLKPTYSAGLVMNGVGNTASKNLFSDGGVAIQLNGNDHVIELNHFHNILFDSDDQGCIYAPGNNLSNSGTIIRKNFFNNIGSRLPGGKDAFFNCQDPTEEKHLTMSIYFDAFDSGNTISENIFYRSKTKFGAVFFNGGVFNKIEKNIFIECYTAYGSQIYDSIRWNHRLGEDKHSIFNPMQDPWYENGEGNGQYVLGYSPYNWFFSDNGQQRFWDPGLRGLNNFVDIREEPFTSKYPHLQTLIVTDASGDPVVNNQQLNNMKNIANGNVIVNCIEPNFNFGATDGIGGFTISNEWTTSDQSIFVNPNSKNFKLTPVGLKTVRDNVGSDFPDIPFENIPKVDYVPDRYSNISEFQSQNKIKIRNCHIENVYNKDGWGNYAPLTNDQASIGGVSQETIGNPGSSVVFDGSWSSANMDADGIIIFAGDKRVESGIEEYDKCSASIVGNHFVNCKGRDVKAQMEEIVIQANISHNAIKPINGGGNRINCQIGCGQVCDNIFHFETAKSMDGQVEGDGNPFSDIPGNRYWSNPAIYEQVDLFNDRIGVNSTIIGFYAGRRLPRNRAITITGNHVYNNVSGSSGYLGKFFETTEGTITSTTTLNPSPTFPNEPKPVLCSVSQNKIIGRFDSQSQMFGYLETRGSQDQSSTNPVTPVYYIINDNMINNLQSGPISDGTTLFPNTLKGFPSSTFLTFANGSISRNFVKCDGNVHARIGTPPPRMAARRPNGPLLDFVYDGNISSVDNRNISSPYYSRSTLAQSFGSRIETLASSDGESDSVRVKGFLRNSDPTGDANYGRILLKSTSRARLSCIVVMSTKDFWEQAGSIFFVSGKAMADDTCLHPIYSAGATTVGNRLVFSKKIFLESTRPEAVDGSVVLWLSQEQDVDALSAGASNLYLQDNFIFYLNFVNRLDSASTSISRRFTFSVFG